MIRYVQILILLLVTKMACGQGHEIQLKFNGISEPSAIVGYHYGKQRLLLDTLTFDDAGILVIKGNEPLKPGVYFLYTPTTYFEFIVNEQQFSIEFDKEEGYGSAKITGSRENELYRQFQESMTRIQREQNRLVARLDSVSGPDSLDVRRQIKELADESRDFRKGLINENSDSYVSSFVKMMEGILVPEFDEIEDPGERQVKKFEYFKQHYFDLLTDAPGMMRTPVIHNFVMKYFNELVLPQADTVNKEIDQWLDRFKDDKDGFRYWLVTLTNTYQESKIMGMDGVTVHLADNYYLTDKVDWMSEKSIADLKKEMTFIRPNLIGNTAPKMNLVDSSLRPFNLESIKTDYLVYFFFDPNCGHCKKKAPILVEIYDEIKSLGGEIVAICTTSDIEEWKEFIIRKEMKFKNLADPYGRANFRQEYNVRTTPQLYILDKERKIVAKKLDVEQVTEFVKNHRSLSEL